MEDIIDHFEDEIDDSLKDWNTFVGAKMTYYIPKWFSLGDNKIVSFNLAAFLFGIFWMIYRKMYLIAFIYGIIMLSSGFIDEAIIDIFGLHNNVRAVERISTISLATIVGMIGNWLYKNHATKKITALKMKGLSKEDYQVQLAKSGGTNITGLVITIFGYIALMGFLLYFLEGL